MEKQRHLRTEVLCQSFVGHPLLSSVIICTHLSFFMYYHLLMWVPYDIFTISSLCQFWGDGDDCHVPKSNIEFQETFSTFVLNLSCDYANDIDDYIDDEIWQTLWGWWWQSCWTVDSRNRIQLLISIFGQLVGLDASYQHWHPHSGSPIFLKDERLTQKGNPLIHDRWNSNTNLIYGQESHWEMVQFRMGMSQHQ